MKNLILLFFTFFIFTGASAQYSKFKMLGDKAFNDANYFQAAYYYKAALDKNKMQPNIPFYSGGKISQAKLKAGYAGICYRLAESYRLYQNFTGAADWYPKVIADSTASNYPLARLWYGVCLRAGKRFDESINQLTLFVTAYKGDNKYIDFAKTEIANCNFAKLQYSAAPQVEIKKMQGAFHGDGGDYALTKNGGSYWFTSSRLSGRNKTHLNRIYSAPASGATSPSVINFGGDSTQDLQYGAPSIAPSGKKIYLTAWSKKVNKTSLAVYTSEWQNNGWSPLTKLNSIINADGYNSLQPFAATDGKHLFFVSDQPGGQGGYDIWMSDLDAGGNPISAVNLGKTINTPSDEEAPFYDTAHQRLVYSSKGLTGLGGFDFFESYQDKGVWSAPQNLGYPANSSKDDLYYFTDPDNQSRAYISSDRESDCCLGLFELNYRQLYISGKVTNCNLGTAVGDVNVSLIDSATKETVSRQITGADGRFQFKISAKHGYLIKTEGVDYFSKSTSPAGKRLNDSAYTLDICLQQFKINKPIVLKNILYDFNQASLRPESMSALDSLVTIMRDNPAIKIELASHTDSIGTDEYNLKLSQQRAQSCVDYMILKGVNSDRIVAKGYGKSLPIAPNSLPNGLDNPDGRQLNRRTEFTVVNK